KVQRKVRAKARTDLGGLIPTLPRMGHDDQEINVGVFARRPKRMRAEKDDPLRPEFAGDALACRAGALATLTVPRPSCTLRYMASLAEIERYTARPSSSPATPLARPGALLRVLPRRHWRRPSAPRTRRDGRR